MNKQAPDSLFLFLNIHLNDTHYPERSVLCLHNINTGDRILARTTRANLLK